MFVKYYTYRYNSVIRIVFSLSAFESVATQHNTLYILIILLHIMSYFKRGKKPGPSFSDKPAKKVEAKVEKCKFHAKHQRNCVDCEKQ